MMKLSYCLIFLLLACSSKPSADDAIARVNGQTITVRDYINLYENLKPKDIALAGKERAEMKNLVIQTLVRRTAILSRAIELNISVTDREVMEGVEKFKAGYPDQIFEEMLLEGMVDESEWKEHVRQNILIEKMFEAKKPQIQAPTLEEALSYYENHPHLFQKPEEVKCLHIVVASKELANDLRNQLKKTKSIEKFKELARQNSTGPEAQDDATITLQKGMMPEALDQTVFSLPEGALSEVVESTYGFHIFRILSKRASVNLDFKQVRQSIFEKLYEDKKQEWLEKFEEDLIRSAEIEYSRELIANL